MRVIETARGPVEIRELSSMDEMVAAERIQKEVWGAEIIPHPKEILIPVQHEGGLLAGAFTAGSEMVGLVFGFPTRNPAAQHSQLLATLEEWRQQGIGAYLKWFQRDWCLERGIRMVRWTVDPLRAANAALNFLRLGGRCSTYYADYYGAMQGIDAGAPTDRLLVEWDLLDRRVAALAQARAQDLGAEGVEPANAVDGDRPARARLDLDCGRILIRLPENFVRLSKIDPEKALEWRLQTRALLQHYFSRGYGINGFTREGGPAYLLERKGQNGS